MENKQTNDLEASSKPDIALPYTVRLSLKCLALAVSFMFASFIFGFMVKPAAAVTLICIGAVLGMLLFGQESEKEDFDDIQTVNDLTKIYSIFAIVIMFLPIFFSWLLTVAFSIFLICVGVVYSMLLLKRHLKNNSLIEDDARGFKYSESDSFKRLDWKKIRRIAIVAVLVITPIYYFADYQRNHTEILKTKTSK